MINIALIGFGSIGLKYFKLLKKNKNFNIIKLLRKKKYTNKKGSFVKFYTNKDKFFLKNKKDIQAYIVASPINTHYQYIKKILTKRKPLIIEKPIVKNVNELKKISRLSSYINYPVLVNHSDLYSPAFKKLKKDIKNLGELWKK